MKMLNKSIIVSAHPDDEVLWFSSLLTRVDKILFCFLDEIADPAFGERRGKAVLHHPLKNVSSLGIASFGAWKPQCFISPRFNKYGIEIAGEDDTPSAHMIKYEKNYHELREKLADVLREYRNVITHNPWGEYGHEDHIQIYRVVSDLQKEIGFDIWYSNYCSTRTVNLLIQCICVAEEATLPADIGLAKKLMKYYEKNACWTWHKDWQWPDHETFFRQGEIASSAANNVSLVPLNLILMPQMPPQCRKHSSHQKHTESMVRKMSKWVLKRGRS
jgi:hypothetical protein